MTALIYAAHLLHLFVFLAFGTVNSALTPAPHGNNNCHLYSASELDTSQCTDELRVEQMVTPAPSLIDTAPKPTAFRDIYDLLLDATRDTSEFVSFALIWMYKNLHCTSDIEAVADLFYNVSPYRLPDNQSPFWMAAYYALHPTTTTSSSDTNSGSIPVVGRRKRQMDGSLGALMTHLTQQIITEAHPSCVQWLINEFRAFATDQFKALYPTFPNPNDYPLGTITDAPTNPSHTTHPHTPHTAHPTTTTTTTTARPTTPTTTSATCTICSSLDCFLSPSVTSCPQSGQEFCLTTVMSSGSGHHITRGCATRAECDSASWRNDPACVGVDTHMLQLSVGVTCHFCCHGNNCNRGPQLYPPSNTLYHAP